MQLEILTPQSKLFSGDVYGVQLPGIDGLFEILENHAPIVAALGKGSMKILNSRTTSDKEFRIEGGFLELLNNHAIVLLEAAEEA